MVALLLATNTLYSGIVLTSVPKSGTHLAIKCIKAITGLNFAGHSNTWITPNPNDFRAKFLAGHTIYSNHHDKLITRNRSRGVLILRDPRDQCISWLYYLKDKHPNVWPHLAAMDFNAALSAWIEDTSLIYSSLISWKDPRILSFKGIDDLYHQYTPWINHPSFYTTTFEKLVGPQGGGSSEEQIQEIMNIAKHIGHPITIQRAHNIADRLFGKRTFRAGKIGAWKTHFTEEHKNLFKEIGGQLLIDLGYEKDLNW